jgi:4-hydroxybenzoate polyprenyltransferase
MKFLVAFVRAMRPHQWVKNLFVFAPIMFAHELHMGGKLLRIVATFGIFCLLSSGVYLMNDVADRAADRVHPRKRNRPIASGEVSVTAAVVGAVTMIAGALAWSHFGLERVPVTAICATYLVIQLLYTFWLKRVVIVDVMCIASGFVLRLLAGSSAAWIEESAWILVCTIFVSLFLALTKRRHEVVSLGGDAAAHRAILADYPPALLDQLIGCATACTLVTYALYTVDERTIRFHHLTPAPILAVTVPFVIFGMFRYLFLVYRREHGGSPTTTLLRDVPLLVNGVVYVATVFAVLRFAH